MVGPYRGLFDTPGVKGFVIAGFVGRMPMSMMGIGIVILVSAVTGSYAVAGAVAATVSVAFAVASPLVGRLIDRFGQARVIVPVILAHGGALAGLMLCARAGAPAWTLYATATLMGVSAVPLGSLTRARWSHVLGDSGRLHAAFSFESVADEMIFVAGPALVTGLAAAVNSYAGLIVALVATVGGTLALAAQRRTEPPVRHRPDRSGSPIAIPGIALLSCVFLALGAVFGSIDLITVAYAEEHGSKGLAGLLLGSIACGSLVSGLWFGARAWKIAPRRRFVRGLGVFAAGLVPMLLIGDVPVMAVAMFCAGLAISPIIITGYTLTERLVPAHLLTEGMSWLSTSIGFGIAVGAWAGGRLTDAYGASNAYAFSLGCAVLAVAVGAAGSGLLRLPEAPSPAKP